MSKKKGGVGKTGGYILLGLLLLGLGGFGATNFGGSVSSIGKVGEAEIPASDYFRAIQQEMRAVQAQTGQALTFQQARAMGIPDMVLSRVVTSAALENEAAQLGISVGDERLAQDLREIPAFQGVDGSFDRESYRLALQGAGFSEREFEEQLRAESASTLLQNAIQAGVVLPPVYAQTLVSYTGERRAFTWAELGAEQLTTGLPVPTDEDLQTFYDENIDRYTRPTTRKITYAWLTPAMIVDTVEVPEDRLRASVAAIDGLVAALTYDDDDPEEPYDNLGTGLSRERKPLMIPAGVQTVRMRSGHDVKMAVPMFPGGGKSPGAQLAAPRLTLPGWFSAVGRTGATPAASSTSFG